MGRSRAKNARTNQWEGRSEADLPPETLVAGAVLDPAFDGKVQPLDHEHIEEPEKTLLRILLQLVCHVPHPVVFGLDIPVSMTRQMKRHMIPKLLSQLLRSGLSHCSVEKAGFRIIN